MILILVKSLFYGYSSAEKYHNLNSIDFVYNIIMSIYGVPNDYVIGLRHKLRFSVILTNHERPVRALPNDDSSGVVDVKPAVTTLKLGQTIYFYSTERRKHTASMLYQREYNSLTLHRLDTTLL